MAAKDSSDEEKLKTLLIGAEAVLQSEAIYLDDTRRASLDENFRVLFDLVRHRCFKRNRFRLLLLGRNSVGKSCLLNGICKAAKTLLPNLLVCTISVDVVRDCTPASILCQELKLTVHPSKSAKERLSPVRKYLLDNKIYLLLVIDEFQQVYTKRFDKEIALDFVDEVACIGGSEEGLIHCILTGSSSVVMRQLCCKTAPAAITDEYPHYANAQDLNCTRFKPSLVDSPIARLSTLHQLREYASA